MAKPAQKQDEVVNPIQESRELEKEQAGTNVLPGEIVEADESSSHIIFTRENLILIGPKFWLYNHDENSLTAVKAKTAFNGQMARDFGIRQGDTVACMPLAGEGILIKVPVKE